MKPDELVIGKIYFICGYHHQTYPIPHIEPLVYVGKNLFKDGEDPNKDEYIFQHPQGYFGKVTSEGVIKDKDSENKDSGEIIFFDDTLHILKNIDGLIEWLQSLKKNKSAETIF